MYLYIALQSHDWCGYNIYTQIVYANIDEWKDSPGGGEWGCHKKLGAGYVLAVQDMSVAELQLQWKTCTHPAALHKKYKKKCQRCRTQQLEQQQLQQQQQAERRRATKTFMPCRCH